MQVSFIHQETLNGIAKDKYMTTTYEIGYIDTDATMAPNSPHLVPSQSAILQAITTLNTSIAAVNPYKSYQAIISQSGTSAPSPTVYKTDFGATTFTWARTSAGIYTVTTSSAVLTTNKTVILLSNPITGLVNYIVVPTSTTVVTVTTILASVIATVLTAVATDSLLTNILIEIRVYP